MTTRDIDALVLKNEEYREKDAIVTVLTSQEILRIRARGVQSLQSKNRVICQPYSWVHITIDKKANRFPLLLYGTTKRYYFHILEDLEIQTTCQVLNDLVHLGPIHTSFMNLVNTCWQAFHTHTNGYTYACLCLKEIIHYQGIDPCVDHCVKCERTDHIEALSIKQGGFLCSYCNPSHVGKKSKADLIQIHSLFHVQPTAYASFCELYTLTLSDFIQWASWIGYHLNLKLPSLRFLTSISDEIGIYY